MNEQGELGVAHAGGPLMKIDVLVKAALGAIATCLFYFVAKDAFNPRNRWRAPADQRRK
jgi:hypothetical protein